MPPIGGQVATYRVYIIEADGRLRLGEGFQARDDDEALARLQTLHRGGLTLELWQGGRLLRRLASDKA